MIDLFLAKNKSYKLKIINELFQEGPQRIYSLANFLKIEPSTTKRYVKELIDELIDIDLGFRILKNDKDEYYLFFNESDEKLNDLTELKLFYCNLSPVFHLCKIICQTNHCSFEDLKKKLLVSSSHAYRIISDFNKIIEDWDILVNINSNNIVEFQGNELEIRIFIYTFVIDLTSATTWFFDSVTKHEILAEISSLSDISHLENHTVNNLAVYFAVLQIRLNNKKYLDPIPDKLFSTFEFFSFIPYKKMEAYFYKSHLFSEKYLYTEYFYANFFLRVFISDCLPENSQAELGRYLYFSKNEDHKVISAMTAAWEKEFDLALPEQKKYMLIYFATLVCTVVFFIKIDLFKIWGFENLLGNNKSKINSSKLNNLNSFLRNHIKGMSIADYKKNALETKALPYLTSLYYLELDMFRVPHVFLYIHFTKDYNSLEFFKNRLRSIYKEEVVVFTLFPEKANLIIADSYDMSDSYSNIIYVSDFFYPRETVKVLSAINNEITKQLNT